MSLVNAVFYAEGAGGRGEALPNRELRKKERGAQGGVSKYLTYFTTLLTYLQGGARTTA